VQLEVKKVMNQNDGNVFYGIINTLADKEAKLGTQLSQAQILFFTAVVRALFLSRLIEVAGISANSVLDFCSQ
jgi:hypothetical protein